MRDVQSKRQPGLRVEWENEPQDWMSEGGLALDATLRQHAPQNLYSDTGEVLVFRISTYKDSIRRYGEIGERSTSLDALDIRMVASPMVNVVSSRQVINTRLCMPLKVRDGMSAALALVGVFIVFLSVFDPGNAKVQRFDPYDAKRTISLTKSHNVTQVARTLCLIVGFYIVLEQTSKDLLKLCTTNFDVLVITLCAAMCEISLRLELFDVYEKITTVEVILEIGEGVSRVLVHWVCAMMDAWINTNPHKVLITFLFLIDLTYSFVINKFFRQWSSWETCRWWSCASREDWFLDARIHEIVFVAKMLLEYLCGHRFAVLKSRFVDPQEKDNVQTMVNRIASRIYKITGGNDAAKRIILMSRAPKAQQEHHIELPYQHKAAQMRRGRAFSDDEEAESVCDSPPSVCSDGMLEFETHVHVKADYGARARTASRPRGIAAEQDKEVNELDEEATMAIHGAASEMHPPITANEQDKELNELAKEATMPIYGTASEMHLPITADEQDKERNELAKEATMSINSTASEMHLPITS